MNPFWTKLAINISVSFGIVFALSAAIFNLGKDIDKNSAKVFELNKNVSSRSTNLTEIARLKAATADLGPLLNKLKRALPDEDALLIDLAGDINTIARRYELGYGAGLKFGPTANVSTGLKSTSFDMNVQGGYQNIIKFLGDVESSGRFIGFTNLDIAIKGNQYTAALSGIIYYSG